MTCRPGGGPRHCIWTQGWGPGQGHRAHLCHCARCWACEEPCPLAGYASSTWLKHVPEQSQSITISACTCSGWVLLQVTRFGSSPDRWLADPCCHACAADGAVHPGGAGVLHIRAMDCTCRPALALPWQLDWHPATQILRLLLVGSQSCPWRLCPLLSESHAANGTAACFKLPAGNVLYCSWQPSTAIL